ncbi:UDP-N-acetylmuramoyl-L-alanyl-D-glutamate--2,6-diaminopimelate ligase [Candidatus Woesebacteria bacterium]|nr:UDP-N-acetylmuramoyl-L-alanyl-D-glutamate--2,6-diaminopimelate ligase [Candidatus Woesebacteria bacterium]
MKIKRILINIARYFRPLFPQVVVNYLYHFPKAYLAARLYGNPSDDLEIIGVTGTDGKTTTSTLIYHILKSAGKKVALVSTVDAKIGRKNLKTGFHVTSPNPFALQALLRRMRSQKIRYVVLEVTSHGLDQFRVYPIKPKIAVLTNITHEHLDYHRTFEAYRDAKLKLFKHAQHAVINKDLPIFNDINARLPKVMFSTYSLSAESQMKPDSIDYQSDKTVFTIGNMTYTLPMTGEYNLYNALAAISTALLLDVSPTDIKRALSSFRGVKGRLEEVENTRGIHAYVDFAHTPNALESVLTNLKSKLKGEQKLIVVFGAAGLRDASKRPLMGKVAGELANEIILTSEDPRFENPAIIAKEIMSGMSPKARKRVTIELDRGKAIDLAVNQIAKKGDWVVTCGKGHEESMNLDGFVETPWSDHEALLNALSKK